MTEIGLCLPQLGGAVTRSALRTCCERAEALGFASLWVQQHLFYPHQPMSGYAARPGLAAPVPYRSTLSALETLSAAAAFFTIPPADVSPKPLHRPRLLSGMRSGPGLRRTAELFDIWNPASGSLADILSTAERLADMRPAHLAPLDLYWRVFTKPPVRVSGLRTRTVDELCGEVLRAREAGIAAVIVDANFSYDIGSGQDWAALPDRLAPLVEAAR